MLLIQRLLVAALLAPPLLSQTGPPLEVLHTTVAGNPTSTLSGLAGNLANTMNIVTRDSSVFISLRTDQLEWGVLQDGVLIAQSGLGISAELITHVVLLDALSDGTFLAEVSTNGSRGLVLFAPNALPVWIARATDPCPFVPGSTWLGTGGVFRGYLAGNGDVYGNALAFAAPNTKQRLIFRNNTLLVAERFTVPTALPNGSTAPWHHMGISGVSDAGSYSVSGSLIDGRFALAIDGALRSISGTPMAGITVGHPFGHVDRAGNWWGSTWFGPTGDDSFVHFEGQLLAQRGDPLTPGLNNYWGSLQQTPLVNKARRYVLRGKPLLGPLARYVHISDRGVDLAPTGAPLDMDGNGLFDDNTFIDGPSPTIWEAANAALSDNGDVYLVLSTKDAANQEYPNGGWTLVRARLSDYDLGQSVCTSVPNSTGTAAEMAISGTDSASQDITMLHAFPVPAEQPGLFIYGQATTQLPFGPGHLCVTAPFTRTPPSITGPTGLLSAELDKQLVGPAGPIQAGVQMSFQAWYRDPDALAATGFTWNTTDAVELLFTP